MPNPFQLSRIGAANDGADKRALFLKISAGEIMSTFHANTVASNLIRTRSISGAKSAQFIALGTTEAHYFYPGEEIVGSKILDNEVVLTVDHELVADYSVADIDELLSSVDLRPAMNAELGEALAKQQDIVTMSQMILAARQTTPRNTGETNQVGSSTAYAATAAGLIDFMFDTAERFDTNNVPGNSRTMLTPPAEYYKLVRDPGLQNQDFGRIASRSSGVVEPITNISIMMAKNLPQTNITDSVGDKYNVDASGTQAIITTPEAVGRVVVSGMSMNMTGPEHFARFRSTLVTASQLDGYGTLRAECAAEATRSV